MILCRELIRSSQLSIVDFAADILSHHRYDEKAWTEVFRDIGKGRNRAGHELAIQTRVIKRIRKIFDDKIQKMADYGEALTQDASAVNLNGKCTILLRLSLAHLISRCYSYWV